MSRVLTVIMGLIGSGAIATGGYVAAYPAPVAPDIAALPRLNAEACRCERRAGGAGKAACWTAFDQAMQRHFDPTTAMAAACFPVVIGQMCMQGTDAHGWGQDRCEMFSEYFYKDGGQQKLCSPAAAKAAKMLWNKALPAGWPAGTIIGRAACSS